MAEKEKDLAIKVEHLTKSFRIPLESSNGIKQKIINTINGRKGYRDFTPLNDISFEVKKGEFFGIVGRNGSGKSTLLKSIAGIYTTESGKVHVDGKLVPFIELGVGFNAELTGRENVYLNGALLGFSNKEMEEMYGEIVDFAELDDFMEERLKNYSSGMQVRLAFSIAIRAKGDVLLLDEVLAVGDEAFQKKCNDYFQKVKDEGRTIVLVTHSMSAVRRFCSRALLLEGGRVKVIGSPEEVANQYTLDNMNSQRKSSDLKSNNKEEAGELKKVSVTPPITDLEIVPKGQLALDRDNTFSFDITYRHLDDTPVYIGISILYKKVSIIEHTTIEVEPEFVDETTKKYTYHLPLSRFTQGEFEVSASVFTKKDRRLLAFTKQDGRCVFVITQKGKAYGGVLIERGHWG